MRWHVTPSPRTQPTLFRRPFFLPPVGARPAPPTTTTTSPASAPTRTSSGPILPHGSHRVLERAPGGEVLPVADAALDLHVLELLLGVVPGLLLLLAVLLPGHAGTEDDVLAHARRVEARPRRVALFQPEFGPALALGHAGVDVFLDDGGPDAAGGFDAFAVVVETVGDDCFGTILVRGHDLRWEGCGVVKVVFDVVGPVWTASKFLERLLVTTMLRR